MGLEAAYSQPLASIGANWQLQDGERQETNSGCSETKAAPAGCRDGFGLRSQAAGIESEGLYPVIPALEG